MSYCRFSDDDFQCNVYCYADEMGGYTTHVAVNCPVLDGTLPPRVPFDKDHVDAWFLRHKAAMAWVKKAARLPIGLPHDGACFNDPDAASAVGRLQMLKAAGYNVPQSAIDALFEEANDEKVS